MMLRFRRPHDVEKELIIEEKIPGILSESQPPKRQQLSTLWLLVGFGILTLLLASLLGLISWRMAEINQMRLQAVEKSKILQGEVRRLGKSIEGLRQEKERLEQLLFEKDQELALYQKQIDKLERRTAKLASKRDQALLAKENLEREIEDTRVKMSALETKMSEVTHERDQLLKEKKALEEASATRTVDLSGASQRVNVGEQGPVPLRQSQSIAKVIWIDREFGFVMVNLGLERGVKVGDRLMISSGGGTKTVVEVEKVYKDMCAAHPIAKEAILVMEAGDTVGIV